MGFNDRYLEDEYEYNIKCTCGAIITVYEDGGVPGCRDVEKVYCPFCLREVASHYGACNIRYIDSRHVESTLIEIKDWYESALKQYFKEYGYDYSTPEYKEITKNHNKKVKLALSRIGTQKIKDTNTIKTKAKSIAKRVTKRFRHDLDYIDTTGEVLAKVHGDKLDITFYFNLILIEYEDGSKCEIENIDYTNSNEITSDIIDLIRGSV